MRHSIRAFLLILIVGGQNVPVLAGTTAVQTVITQGTDISADVSPAGGRLAIDLLGSIWIVPPTGGPAVLAAESVLPARRPRWSPDGRRIVYQAVTASSSRLWLLDVESGEQQALDASGSSDRDASWHPHGERIVFSSSTPGEGQGGFDLWEVDLRSGLRWRLSNHPGDETQPAWSASGRDLAYILHDGEHWSLMLRRFGQPDVELLRADERLAAPSWRPDGTLITYLRESHGRLALQMAILSNPPLFRELAADEDFSLAPVSWRNREQFYYAADGLIKTRNFDDWTAKNVAFRASVGDPPARQQTIIVNRELPIVTPAADDLVIRAGRVFDGLARDYRTGVDVRVANGLIVEITPRREWDDIAVLDLGATTLVPGLIDVYSRLPQISVPAAGAELLSWGITTLVSPDRLATNATVWEGDDQPGPRLLAASRIEPDSGSDDDAALDDDAVFLWTVANDRSNEAPLREQVHAWQQLGRPVLAESWRAGLSLGTHLILGADALPESPMGNRYEDIRNAGGVTSPMLVSSVANAGTPGLPQLFDARQATRFHGQPTPARGPASRPDLRGRSGRLIAGSRANGLPPGLALHAELRALSAAGLAGDQVFKAAGANAARVLGLTGQVGEISPGARADLLLVEGDPLNNVADTQRIVAVVRNGRFYSLISLLERAANSVD